MSVVLSGRRVRKPLTGFPDGVHRVEDGSPIVHGLTRLSDRTADT